MTLKDILSAALTYMGMDADVLEGESPLQDDEVKLLVRCVGFTLDEIAAEYLPLTACEQLEASGKSIAYSAFALQPLRIKKVSREGKTQDFVQRVDCVQVACDGAFEVEYSYLPPHPSALTDGALTALPLPAKTVALGVCSQYCLITGRYEQSGVFSGMFSEDMRTQCRPAAAVRWEAGGGELNENFELVKNGQVVTEVRKMTKEEIDLTVRRVSRIVKIGMFMDRYPAELSGGQQQRVAIARTLAPEPSVLFMDEPLSNLDAKLRLEMRYELQRLHLETGSTFVYVTHDQMEAMTLATQICLIDNGVLQQYDAPLTVYHQPSNLFVADFVGNPSINFVEASGEQQEDGSVALTLFRNRRARFRPARPLDLKSWFQARDREAQERAELRRKQAADKNYVEKGNKDEVFRYHIAKVVEEDDSLQEEPVLTNQDLVLGVRPEFLDIEDSGSLDGEIYGAMPTGMESTIKVRVDDFLLTGVVFGSTLFSLGAKVRLNISSDNIMLFDRQSGRCITQGSLEFLQV